MAKKASRRELENRRLLYFSLTLRGGRDPGTLAGSVLSCDTGQLTPAVPSIQLRQGLSVRTTAAGLTANRVVPQASVHRHSLAAGWKELETISGTSSGGAWLGDPCRGSHVEALLSSALPVGWLERIAGVYHRHLHIRPPIGDTASICTVYHTATRPT